jgi:hypothetical protein
MSALVLLTRQIIRQLNIEPNNIFCLNRVFDLNLINNQSRSRSYKKFKNVCVNPCSILIVHISAACHIFVMADRLWWKAQTCLLLSSEKWISNWSISRHGYVTFCNLLFTISNCIVRYITAYIVEVLFSIPTSEFQFWNYGRRLIICHS